MLLLIRRRRPGKIDSPDGRQPIKQVHIDQTATTSIAKVRKFLPACDAPKFLEHRFQIINDQPLATRPSRDSCYRLAFGTL